MEHLTDLGNAEELIKQHGDEICYVADRGWYVWDGKRWMPDKKKKVMHLASLTVRDMYKQAAAMEKDTERLELIQHATKSESAQRIKAMVDLAENRPTIVAQMEDFDQDDFLFNANNGTIDLRTGNLKAHDPKDRITKLSPVNYNSEACSMTWENFITAITDNDEDLSTFLQRAVGYSLTGSMKEEKLFIPHGSGRNGKSKFLEAIYHVMGDYAQDTPTRTFMRKDKSSGLTNDVAGLVGARMVTAVETEAGKSLDIPTVKQITGGDRMTCRQLYKDNFTYKPKMKLWMATNNMPEIKEDSVAIWERIDLIPFTVSFVGREDRELSKKLIDASDAILSWAVKGCTLWQEIGLQEPACVKVATKEYKEDQDILAEFFAEKCEEGDDKGVKARELYRTYQSWCSVNGSLVTSETDFGSRVMAHGYRKVRIKSGNIYKGIGLTTQQERPLYLSSHKYVEDEDLGNAF